MESQNCEEIYINNEQRILEIKQQYMFISDEEIENLNSDVEENMKRMMKQQNLLII